MHIDRRRALHLLGSGIGVGSVGCLSNPITEPGADGADGEADDDDVGDGGPSSIDARLANDDTAAHRFSLVIRDDGNEVVAEEEWAVDAAATTIVPDVGRTGESRTVEAAVDGGTRVAETYDFDVGADRDPAGYVDITYTAEGLLGVTFTPIDDGESTPRVDFPSVDIDERTCSGDGDRDPRWLCEGLSAEPSLPFVQGTTTSPILRDEGLRMDHEEFDPQYFATLMTSDADLDRLDDDAGGPSVETIRETDFDTEAVVIVQTGWGSGSMAPHLRRIETTADGIHAHGCIRRPCGGTADVTMRTVVARFERPLVLEVGTVSLVVDPEAVVTIRDDDGVVTFLE